MLARSADPVLRDGLAGARPALRNRTSVALGADRSHKATPCGQFALGSSALPEGIEGVARFHSVIADHLGVDDEPADVIIAIETDRGRGCRR